MEKSVLEGDKVIRERYRVDEKKEKCRYTEKDKS
jgi:hypothetical protein